LEHIPLTTYNKYNPDLVVVYFHRGELSTIDLSEFEADKVVFQRLGDNRVEIEIRGLGVTHHLNKVAVTLLNFIQRIPFYEFVFSKSHAVRFFESRLRSDLVSPVEESSKNNIKKSFDSWGLKNDDSINWKTDYWELKDKTKQHIPAVLYSIGIDRFYSLLQEYDTKLLFLLIPSREEVLKMNKGFEEFKPMLIGHHENMIWLDLKKDLMEIQNLSYVPLNFPQAIHFTPAGHLAAATLAFDNVVKKGFISTDNLDETITNFRDPTWIKKLHDANGRISPKLSQLGYDFLIKGILKKNQNKFDQAEELLKLASEKKAVSVEAAWQLGRLYFVRRDFGNSVDFIQKALKQGLSQSDSVFSLLAKANFNLKRFDFAEKYFEKAIEISPNNFRNYVNYAQMLFFSKRFEESLGQYKKANLIVPGQIDILLGIGGASFLIGKREDALRAFEKVLKIQPNNVQALSSVERIESRIE
jgi:tetratricopeptide (TPR) repeat protein